jgi:RNA ligase (TIGR02306 family)
MTDRKLLRVVQIDDVVEHSNADSLEIALVGGWQVCVKKGEFAKSDLAVYAEVDAMLPVTALPFVFLAGSSNYTVEEKQYARVKTIKLRKELSQGILFKLSDCSLKTVALDADLSDCFGVIKYEAPAERNSGSSFGSMKKSNPFPSFIHKTDQERVQNLSRLYNEAVATGEEFEISFKLDGSSFTAYIKDGKVGVCSRNIELQLEKEDWGIIKQVKTYFSEVKKHGFKYAKWKTGIDPEANSFTSLFKVENISQALKVGRDLLGVDFAIQGEMVGPSIQGNFEGVDKNKLFIYSVFDITNGKYLLPDAARAVIGYIGLQHVPLVSTRAKLPEEMKDVILAADGPSSLGGKYREGLVFKSLDRAFTFKVISNKYLLKEA